MGFYPFTVYAGSCQGTGGLQTMEKEGEFSADQQLPSHLLISNLSQSYLSHMGAVLSSSRGPCNHLGSLRTEWMLSPPKLDLWTSNVGIIWELVPDAEFHPPLSTTPPSTIQSESVF